MNWRKPIIYSLLYLSGSKIPKNLKEIKKLDSFSLEEKKTYQQDKLKKLLLYAYNNTIYYNRVLKEAGVIKNNEVFLENFDKIPILTKDIIRKEGKNLYSKEKRKGVYENTSGGSTGEPVRFLQDKYYNESNIATKIFLFKKLGKDVGEREIKLWGSDRDIIKGNLTIKDRLTNFLYHRRFFNCYNFSVDDMHNLVSLNNTFKPAIYWAYVDSMSEFSKYIIDNKIQLVSPKFIITTIGPLFHDNRQIIKKAFKCKVYNQYGSREMGIISAENSDYDEMDIFFWRNAVELLGNDNEKQLIATSLDNYSMPLIRYSIGDVAEYSFNNYKIGKTSFYLSTKPIVGRTLGFFKLKDGSLKHTHFIVQQLFFRDWIKKFQLIQTDYDNVVLRIVGDNNSEEMKIVEDLIIRFLGSNFKIEWNLVDEIKATKSGKYLYTICEIK